MRYILLKIVHVSEMMHK